MSPITYAPALLLSVPLGLLAGSAASAQLSPPPMCIPDAASDGVSWWTSPETKRSIHAPFKSGAVATRSDEGRLAMASMLWEPDAERIVVRIQLQGDPAIDPVGDRFVLALSDATGEQPELFAEFQPLLGCDDLEDCDDEGAALSPDAIQYSEAWGVTAVSWTDPSPVNPSADFAVIDPWIAVRTDTSGPSVVYDWTLTFALEVPVDPAGDIRPELRVYGSVIDPFIGVTSVTQVELPVLCESASLIGDTCLVYATDSMAEFPDDLPIANILESWPQLSSVCGGTTLLPSL